MASEYRTVNIDGTYTATELVKLLGDGTANFMCELFYHQGFSVKNEYTEVNLQRINILFDLEFLKDVGFHFDTNLAANITQIFNLQSTFQTSTTIENNDYMRVMLDIVVSENSYPKLADVITTNTYNLNMRMGILEFNNSGGGRTSGPTTSSTGGDMGDYTLITTTDELEANVVTLTDNLEDQIATLDAKIQTNVIAKIDDHESRIINKSETNDPVFNIAGFGNGKTMNDIVSYYAPTTDLSSYVTISHFESIYDGIDSRFDLVDASIQGNTNDLQRQITSLDGRFDLADALIQGNQIDLPGLEKLAQGHTQQNTTQNNRLGSIEAQTRDLGYKVQVNSNKMVGMDRAIQ